ncbi:DMT family transporter [Endozoicomonas sp. Mp262]|uniref:DMT family transporter n=1 Tax=Endozoicomonas sp. Mp262 TaxID=2919499 RepID=UPI0021DAF739
MCSKKAQWRLNREQVKILLPATLIGFCVNCTAFFYAYTLMSPSMATILFFMYPFFVLLYEVVIQKQPVFIYKVLALALAFAGLIFIIWDGNTTLSLMGVALSMGAGICYAGFCGSLTSRPLQAVDAYVLSAWVTTISAVIFMIMCLTKGQPLLSNHVKGWFYTSLIAIICTVLATVSIYTAIHWIGATNASIIATAEPVIVFIFGFIFLDEKLTASIALGIMLVVSGLLIMQWPDVKKGFLRKARGQAI